MVRNAGCGVRGRVRKSATPARFVDLNEHRMGLHRIWPHCSRPGGEPSCSQQTIDLVFEKIRAAPASSTAFWSTVSLIRTSGSFCSRKASATAWSFTTAPTTPTRCICAGTCSN